MRGKKRNFAAVAALSLSVGLLAALLPTAAQAAEGWNMTERGWSYYNQSNEPVMQAWRQSRQDWYYLGEDGLMLKQRLFRHRDAIYYVGQDGKMAKDTWVFADASNSDSNEFESGWYYFGTDGKGYQRRYNSFRRTIGDSSYIFDENGKMLTGWMDGNGEPVEDTEDAFVEGVYYARPDGRLLSGEWLDYTSLEEGDGGSELESAVAGRNYRDYKQLWLYFDSNSKKVKGDDAHLRQRTIDGVKYGFDENGIMLPWWSWVGNVVDRDKSNPTSDVSARFFSGYDGGLLLTDSWFWMYPSENLDENDYDNQESSWWRTDRNGEVYRNSIRSINGRSYIFDGLGRMRTGFVLYDKMHSTFVAQYRPDDWSSQDFIEGNLYGLEKSDLYLFSPDELNDGSMQTGEDIAVELEDGVFHFGFSSNGIAYGNQNRMQKRGGRYYINGLRLEADREYGYGVVEVENNGETYYQVVDTSGKVIEGARKVIRDKDGGYLLIIRNRFVARLENGRKPVWRVGEDGAGYYRYDRDNRRNHYIGGLIAGADSQPDISGLPESERLNF